MSGPNPADTAEFPVLDDPSAMYFGPSPPPVTVEFGAFSHVGAVRTNNEDHFLVNLRRRTRTVLMTNLPDGFLPPADDNAFVLAVADGLGGAAFGEIASMMALRSAWDQAPSTVKWMWIVNDREIEEFKEKLQIVFNRVNQSLIDRGKADPRFAGMATTLTGAYTVGPEAFIAHVGDSRAYLFHQGVLSQLTRDHTLAQESLDAGLLVPHRSWYHTLTNCLGGSEDGVHLDFHHFQLTDGDQLLLCTDGLTDMVGPEQISRILNENRNPNDSCKALVAAALKNGGRDNVTVVVGRYSMAPMQ